MTGADFAAWRARMGWGVSETSRRTGLARNTIGQYEGGRAVPLYVSLACSALEAGLSPAAAVEVYDEEPVG
jgi:transcriptional regulator with XRE-family HTH domain